MTNSWHRYASHFVQADDFLKYFDDLLTSQDFGQAQWALDYHPYVESVVAVHGASKIDKLRKELKTAISRVTARQDMIF